MKKILFIITIVLTSVIFTNCVSAYDINYVDRLDIDYNVNFINYDDVKQEIFYQNQDSDVISTKSINEAFDNLINEFNSQSQYDSYFIFNYNTNVRMILYNSATTYDVFDFLFTSSYCFEFYWYQKKYTPYSNRIVIYNMVDGSISKQNIGYSRYLYINNVGYYSYDEEVIYITSTNKMKSCYDVYYATNDTDLQLIYRDDKSKYSEDYNINGNIYNNVYYNDTLLFSEGESVFKKEPVISFENLVYSYDNDNNKIGASIDVVLNNIDNNKHLVQYSSKVNNDYYLSQGYVEQWIDIEDTTQPFNYSTSINDTLFVRIIDKQKYYDSVDKGEELDIDVIKASTFTFTGIEEITPYITYNITTPKECKISGIELGGVFSRSACQKLSADIHNMSFEKYSLYYLESDNKIEYSDITEVNDTSNWSGLYATTFNKTYSTNKYVAIIVYDKQKSKVANVKIIHLDVVDIATSGFSIKFSSSYKNNGNYVDLKLTIYNDNNYTYFYSTNGGIDYTKINDISLVDDRMTIKEAHIPIYQNGQVLIKVVDTNGEVVGIYDTIISYDELGETFSNSSPSSLIDYISNFVDNLKEYSDFFNRAFDLFFNGLPELVRMFSIVVWIIFLLFFGMQLGGWK